MSKTKTSATFKVGDIVTWRSAAQGSWKQKTGTVTAVSSRGECTVSVPVGKTESAKPRVYRPRTSALQKAPRGMMLGVL